MGAAAPQTALYLTESGDTTAISFHDIHQGQIGDCFLLSSIGELAMHHSAAISNLIHDNGNGTETVTLYTDRSGAPVSFGSSVFARTSITVSNKFSTSSVNNQASQDVVKGVKEIWVQAVEKAVALLDSTSSATTASIQNGGALAPIANGGSPVLAMEALTGNKASYASSSSVSLTALQSHVSANGMIIFDTLSSFGTNGPYSLVGSHAYMFDHLVGSGSSAAVVLDNPWGCQNPTSAIPLSAFSRCFAEVDFCKTA